MLEIKELSKSFGKKKVLHNISCSLDTGIYGLLGPNGAGKTTLLRCVLGLYPFEKGEIWLDGRKITDIQRQVNIGYLPQKSGVFPGLTVEEYLRYFSNLKKLDKTKTDAFVNEALEMVHLTEQRKMKGHKLSGGMVRRLGIAQAVLGMPELVIFDEPTTGLDPEERMRFKNIVRQMGKETTVIMSTHIVEDVEAVCSRILIMKDGTFSMQGTQEEVIRCAEGLVYELPREELLNGDYIEKEKEQDGREILRVITARNIDINRAVKPTIEDGYLCRLKNIVK